MNEDRDAQLAQVRQRMGEGQPLLKYLGDELSPGVFEGGPGNTLSAEWIIGETKTAGKEGFFCFALGYEAMADWIPQGKTLHIAIADEDSFMQLGGTPEAILYRRARIEQHIVGWDHNALMTFSRLTSPEERVAYLRSVVEAELG
jgi:hypothetical protein